MSFNGFQAGNASFLNDNGMEEPLETNSQVHDRNELDLRRHKEDYNNAKMKEIIK